MEFELMMARVPRASVLMPIYRTDCDFVRKAVDSIVGQTMTDWELIIVEDPSESVCRELIDGYNDSRIRYHLNSERTGLVAQRNRALELAIGDLIVKADADDISVADRLEKQCRYLDDHPAIGVVGSALTIVDARDKTIGHRPYPTEHEHICRLMRRRNPIAQPAVCFRRNLWLQHGGYPSGYPVCQDYAYWSHLARRGVRFANLPDALVRYRQHDGSIKATRLHESIDATLRVKREFWADKLSLSDRCRMLAESALKYLPVTTVTRLFSIVTYRQGSPKQSSGSS